MVRLVAGEGDQAFFSWITGHRDVHLVQGTDLHPGELLDPTSSSKTYQNTDQPFLLNANIVHTVAKLFENRSVLSWATRDWQVGAFLQYASGLPLTPPSSIQPNPLTAEQWGTTNNYQFRVPGKPLYLKNPNCGCINPYYDQVLNPDAWTNPPVAGLFGTNALDGDFRAPRRPQENFNIGRNFRVKERYNLQIRGEFVNILNRTYLGNPSTTLALNNPLSRNPNGLLIGGFGVINDVVSAGLFQPRQPTETTTRHRRIAAHRHPDRAIHVLGGDSGEKPTPRCSLSP